MAIRAIICDFGGVLTTPLIGSFEAFERDTAISGEQLGTAMAATSHKHDGENPLFVLERGHMTEEEFLADLADELEKLVGRRPDLSDFKERFFAALDPDESMIGLMAELADSGEYVMSMLTNNVREWRPLWYPMLPVDEIFHLVIDSSHVGMRKPDHEIYHHTLEAINEHPEARRNGDGPILPEHCLFIDDTLPNIEAAAEIGIHGVHVRHDGEAVDEIRKLLAQ